MFRIKESSTGLYLSCKGFRPYTIARILTGKQKPTNTLREGVKNATIYRKKGSAINLVKILKEELLTYSLDVTFIIEDVYGNEIEKV